MKLKKSNKSVKVPAPKGYHWMTEGGRHFLMRETTNHIKVLQQRLHSEWYLMTKERALLLWKRLVRLVVKRFFTSHLSIHARYI